MQVSTKLAVIVQLSEDEARQVIQDLNPYVFNNDATNALLTQLDQALQEKQAPAPLAKTDAEPKASRKNTPLTLNAKNTNAYCKICGRQFAKPRGLSRHMATHRDDGDSASLNLDADDAE